MRGTTATNSLHEGPPRRERFAAGVIDCQGQGFRLVTLLRAGGAVAMPVPRPAFATDLLDLADRAGLDQVWVLESAARALGLPERMPPASRPNPPLPFFADREGWSLSNAGARPWYHAFRPAAHDAARALAFPAWDDRMRRWTQGADPATLLGALRQFCDLLGVAWTRSTRRPPLGRLLLGLQSRPLLPVPMPEPARDAGLVSDLYTARSLSITERRRRYLVGWDVNGAYLAACSSLRVGVGPFQHRDAADPMFARRLTAHVNEHRQCGYYRIGSEWTVTAMLPPVMTGASVREAFIWEAHARPLEAWYRVLRDARASLIASSVIAADALALRMLKDAYTQFLGGFLCSDKWDRSTDPLYRPDIRHAVIAEARRRREFTLARLAGGAEADAPVAVLNDALYFASDDPRYTPPLTIGYGLGQFKRLGAVPLRRVLGDDWPSNATQSIHDAYREARA